MRSSPHSLRTALLYLGLWGGLALIPIILAIYLTKMIVYVNRNGFDSNKSPVQKISIFTKLVDNPPWWATHPPIVYYSYDEGEKETTIEFRAWVSSAKIILNNLLGKDSCVAKIWYHDKWAPQFAVTLDRLDKNHFGESLDDTYLIQWHTIGWEEISIRCKLKSIAEPQTYTERGIQFYSESNAYEYQIPGSQKLLGDPLSPEPWGKFDPPVKWTLDPLPTKGIENISFAGHTHERSNLYGQSPGELGATRQFLPADFVEVRWESLAMRSRRDIYIVIIGALVALGAAMLIESVRPVVELLVGAHESSGQVSAKTAPSVQEPRSTPDVISPPQGAPPPAPKG